ncbi:DUF1648 domain-containing protein [Streptomyces sp. NRRL S-1448]|uniref:DUF1648 domain-containing protein n=1 Tax=Streptomyces sp. NRRL S-1448 TaxID=1463883 RepID=UPI001F273DEC|nr:DUF1648 domain-containing protein [Streptomyces sp. NRRL S-1448]
MNGASGVGGGARARSGLASSGPWWALIAAFPFVAALTTVVLVYAVVADRLPEPLATHFTTTGGRADGYGTAQDLLTVVLGLLVVFGAVFGALLQVRAFRPATPWLIAGGYATAAGVGYPGCLTLLANEGVADASAVRLPLWHLPVLLVVALAAGVLGRLLAGAPPRLPHPESGGEPRLDLPPGTAAGWSRTVSSPLMAVLGGVLFCAGLVLGVLVGWPALSLILAGVLVLPFASVRVTVDRRGLTVAPTLLPSRLRIRRVPLDRIAQATGRPIAALREYGGWGYRIRSGGSGLILRSGDGIVVTLTGGRTFAVTVDDAATAAALLNTYADRARSQQGG